MGMFDYIYLGKGRTDDDEVGSDPTGWTQVGQVKLWDCNLDEFTIGDSVPSFGTHKHYSIAMREGGYVNVCDMVVVSWTKEAIFKVVCDKWGHTFDPEEPGTYFENATYFVESEKESES